MFVKSFAVLVLLSAPIMASSPPDPKPIEVPADLQEKMRDAFVQKLSFQEKLSPSRVAGWAVFVYCYIEKAGFGRSLELTEAMQVLRAMLPLFQAEGFDVNEEVAEAQVSSLYEYVQKRFLPHPKKA